LQLLLHTLLKIRLKSLDGVEDLDEDIEVYIDEDLDVDLEEDLDEDLEEDLDEDLDEVVLHP